MKNNCVVIIKGESVEAEFIGVFQVSKVVGESPMIGGHRGGAVAGPVAVVKTNEKLLQVELSAVTFKSE